jgi:hypothetical protein
MHESEYIYALGFGNLLVLAIIGILAIIIIALIVDDHKSWKELTSERKKNLSEVITINNGFNGIKNLEENKKHERSNDINKNNIRFYG